MKLVIQDKQGNETEGTLLAKDSSFLFIRTSKNAVEVWAWDEIPKDGVMRVTPNGRTVVNVRVE